MERELVAEALADYPLFEHLEEATKERLIEEGSIGEYLEQEAIVTEGEPASHLFILLEGQVRVWTQAGTREVELCTFDAGAYFGEVSILSGKPATATVEASSELARVLGLPRPLIQEIVAFDEPLRRALEGSTLARAKDTISKVLG